MGGAPQLDQGLWSGSHAELPLPGASAGQHQRLRPVPAAVRRELLKGKQPSAFLYSLNTVS